MKDYSIAPFEIEQRDEDGEYQANWSDVCEEARRHLLERGEQPPEYGFPILSVSYWFKELRVAWNGEAPTAFMADREENPWIIVWRAW